MMQNLLINTPFTGEPASASELFHRAVPPATSPPFPWLKSPSLCCVAERLSVETGIKMPTRPLHQHTHNQMHINTRLAVVYRLLKPTRYL